MVSLKAEIARIAQGEVQAQRVNDNGLNLAGMHGIAYADQATEITQNPGVQPQTLGL